MQGHAAASLTSAGRRAFFAGSPRMVKNLFLGNWLFLRNYQSFRPWTLQTPACNTFGAVERVVRYDRR
jgi:hypothetical protein